MATIKEKANEYAKDYLFRPLPQRAPNIHFEAGANYVLEEIEKFADCTWGVKSLNTMSLKKMIKKLKGE